MTTTQLSIKKMEIIEMLVSISDEKTLTKIAALIRKSGKVPELQPMTIEVYNKMIDKSLEDVRAGRTISHEEMGKLIERWQ